MTRRFGAGERSRNEQPFNLKRAVESLKLPFALSPSAALRRAPSKGER